MAECLVAGCGKNVFARGYCNSHYNRLRIHGDPLGGRPLNGEPMRWVNEVALNFKGDECLIWPYTKDRVGYARVRVGAKGARLVHRILCEQVNGPPISSRLEAAHNCGRGHDGCVNPRHLSWKTPKENQADRLIHGTHGRGERCANAKLSEVQVLEIRRLSGTMLQKDIAKIYGIKQQQVSSIITRRTWSWLNDSCVHLPAYVAEECE